MSMYLEFEPHSWYMGFAIKDDRGDITEEEPWTGYTDDGNTYRIVKLGGGVLTELKANIRDYHVKQGNWYGEQILKRLNK